MGRQATHCLNFFIEDFCYGGRTPDQCAKFDSSFVMLQSDKEYKDSKKTWSAYGLSVRHPAQQP